MPPIEFIRPNWPAPSQIKAATSLRTGGMSQGKYSSLNLALHVGDDEKAVMGNRKLLKEALNLPQEPLWLNQVHGDMLISASQYYPQVKADGIYSQEIGMPCVIMTGDCLPVLVTNSEGNFVMALHCGWRSLAAGLLEKAINKAKIFTSEIMVWLGPAITQENYQIGPEVKECFTAQNPKQNAAFKPSISHRWLMDIYTIVKIKLIELNITSIYSHIECTYKNKERYFSHRRDHTSGRMATVIWMV